MNTTQSVIEVRQSEPTKILVESKPVQEGQKLPKTTNVNTDFSWTDMRGLGWIFVDPWSE